MIFHDISEDETKRFRTMTSSHSSYVQIISALFKKQFLIKFRNRISVFEFVLSLFFYWILFPVYRASIEKFPEIRNQSIKYNEKIPMDLITFFHVPNTKVLLIPDTQPMHDMLNFMIRPLLFNTTNVTIRFCDNYDDMKNIIDKSDSNAIGIMWKNSISVNNSFTPKIEIYYQTLYGEPNRNFFSLLTTYLTSLNIRKQFGNPRLYRILTSNVTAQHYPEMSKIISFDITYFFALISVIPIFLATIPDFEVVLEEKETKVTELMFLMGCPEFCYWFVNIVTPFLMSIPSSFLMCFCYVHYFYLNTNNTSLSLLFVITLLYSLANIAFQTCVSAFLKTPSDGKSFTITILMLSITLCIIHGFFTLKETNPYYIIKHFFSIVPFSCYQMAMGAVYMNCRKMQPPVSWSNLDGNLTYTPKMALIWLLLDIFVYFVLFFVFNAVNERGFGLPIIKKSERFKIQSWINLIFSKKINKSEQFNGSHENKIDLNEKRSNLLFEVNRLSKIYNGRTTALDYTNFKVYENEIIVIVGSNGAGKSTLINILSGAIQQTSGEIFVSQETNQISNENINMANTESNDDFQKTLKNNIGVVFQDNVFFDKLTVLENLELFSIFKSYHKMKNKKSNELFTDGNEIEKQNEIKFIDEINITQNKHDINNIESNGTNKNISNDLNSVNEFDEIEHYLSIFQMTGKKATFAHDLSGGQKRKLCISIALLGKPPILFLDEPTNGVDFQSRQLIWKTVASLRGVTSMVATHALEEAESISSRVFIVADKRIPFAGTTTELRKISNSHYVLRLDLYTSLKSHHRQHQQHQQKYENDITVKKFSQISENNDDKKEENNDDVDDDVIENRMMKILAFAKRFVPDAAFAAERNALLIPVACSIPDLLEAVDKNREEFQIRNYTFSVEPLECLFARIASEEFCINVEEYNVAND